MSPHIGLIPFLPSFHTMPSLKFVGHVSLKSFVDGEFARQSVVDLAKPAVLAFVAEGGFSDFCAVYEEGTENGAPHLHFYLESAKSQSTLRRLFEKHFKKGTEGQWMSLKVADNSKLDKYFLYLAKGVTGQEDEDPIVLYDSTGRLRYVVEAR